MTVFVDAKLSASPNPTSLPKRMAFTQTLHSDLDAEPIIVAYSLDPAHNVWFQDTAGNQQKRILRQETIGKAPHVCVDRVPMVLGPGQGGLLTVEVSQVVRDAEGNVLPSVVVLQLKS